MENLSVLHLEIEGRTNPCFQNGLTNKPLYTSNELSNSPKFRDYLTRVNFDSLQLTPIKMKLFSVRLLKWSKSDASFVKLNSDRCGRGNSSVPEGGRVVRDSNGQMVFVFVHSYESCYIGWS